MLLCIVGQPRRASASPRSRRSARASSNRKMPISVASRGVDRLRGDRDVGAALDVRVDQLAEVHAIEVVARENQIVVGVVAAKCRAACRTASAVPWNQSELSGVCSAASTSTKPPENMSSR